MGKMGRAIDALPDDVKDYMVRSQRWVSGMDAKMGEGGSWDLDDMMKCPAVHVVAACGGEVKGGPALTSHGASGRGGGNASIDLPDADAWRRYMRIVSRSGINDIGPHYDRLCERFGQRRIVRLIKQRAAATMSTEVETPAPVEVCTADPLNSGYREGA